MINYSVKSSSDNLSNENINTGVSRRGIVSYFFVTVIVIVTVILISVTFIF